MIKAILIDDEINATEALTNMIRLLANDVEVVTTFNDPMRALTYLRQHTPDVLFLDIQMPYLTGFELLEQLGAIKFPVVFTTAYDQYALQAFKTTAVDYLLKPIDLDELEAALQKIRERQHRPSIPDLHKYEELFRQMQPLVPQRLGLPTSDGLVFVAIADIVRLESDSNYTIFYFANSPKILVSRTMGE